MTETDPDQSRAYSAQEGAEEFFSGHGTIADPMVGLEPEGVIEFARATLDLLSENAREPPNFELGMAEGDPRAGRYDFERDVIQLHPYQLNRWRVLHEMAHWFDPAARLGHPGHGPRFRTIHCFLVSAALGDEAGGKLAEMYRIDGVPIEADISWAEAILPNSDAREGI
jgi:hypothetical protein